MSMRAVFPYRGLSPAACALIAAACATTPSPPATPVDGVPVPGTAGAQRTAELPPIPSVDGALDLRISYPPEGSTIAVRDSNFIFGSTGSGRTQLTINGLPVTVAPNGGFLAFIAVPADGVYRLNATKDGATTTLEHRINVPAGGTAPGLAITSAFPTGVMAVEHGENIEIGFRAPAGVRAAVLLPDGRRVQLMEQGGAAGALPGDEFRTGLTTAQRQAATVRYSALVSVTAPLISRDTSLARPSIGYFERSLTDTPLPDVPLGAAVESDAVLEIITGTDTVRQPLRLNVAVLPGDIPRVGIVTPPADPPSDWAIRGRYDVAGPFHFFWPGGTRLTITGERNGMYRVHLAGNRTAWVPAGDVRLLPVGAPPAAAAVAAVRFSPEPQYIDLRIPVSERLPFQVIEDENRLHIDVFGAVSRINFFQYGGLDPLITYAEWSQPADSVLRISVEMSEPVWGYAPFHDAGGALVLRIRRPPAIDPAAPLRGLFIGVDAGHGGEDRSTRGPTDFREADANLAVALQLQALLERAGARVLMSRTPDLTVPLNARPRIAADSGVHVLVSVHNNAFPDGVNPWENAGSSTYYYQPRSADLARLMQRELLDELGLRDIGYGRADLALVRPTWMPAVLTETAFMMIPEQEAALRDPAVQLRIAQAHVRALEAFLRSRAHD